jgi:L-ascorbate metabolism protein UlaG (beta-lactamase superfamily)
MEIIYYGHSAFVLNGSRSVYIDPFLSGNPSAALSVKDIDKADMVIVTHDHGDHMGDGFEICKKTGAVFVSQHELAVMAQEKGLRAEGMNIGGTIDVNGVSIHMTHALHSTQTGHPTGVVVTMDGHAIYHAGDTGLFSDMKLIGEMYKPEVALLPIGDRYTMGIEEAVRAVGFVKPKYVIPMHYGTFPIIETDPEEFASKVRDMAEVKVLKPGERFELS